MIALTLEQRSAQRGYSHWEQPRASAPRPHQFRDCLALRVDLLPFGIDAANGAGVASATGSVEVARVASGPHRGGTFVTQDFRCRKLRQRINPLPELCITSKQRAPFIQGRTISQPAVNGGGLAAIYAGFKDFVAPNAKICGSGVALVNTTFPTLLRYVASILPRRREAVSVFSARIGCRTRRT